MLTVADTAFAIAAVRAEEAFRPPDERLFEDPYAALFRAAGVHAEDGTQRYLSLPFFRDGIRLRTRFIDDALADGLAADLDQIVLLGAGFDARALRIPALAAHRARVFEVDLADQLDRKRGVLETAGVTLPALVSYVACDFTAPAYEGTLARSLEALGFRRDHPSFIIWEGVTTYIGVAATDRTLGFLAALCGPGTRVVFDVGSRFFDPETVFDHVTRAGFSACEAHGGDALWLRYLRGEPHPAASVFRMVVANR
jgi:methyltransferase (TIGR00027 family)